MIRLNDFCLPKKKGTILTFILIVNIHLILSKKQFKKCINMGQIIHNRILNFLMTQKVGKYGTNNGLNIFLNNTPDGIRILILYQF